MAPWVVSALKEGALSPMRGKRAVCSVMENLLVMNCVKGKNWTTEPSPRLFVSWMATGLEAIHFILILL